MLPLLRRHYDGRKRRVSGNGKTSNNLLMIFCREKLLTVFCGLNIGKMFHDVRLKRWNTETLKHWTLKATTQNGNFTLAHHPKDFLTFCLPFHFKIQIRTPSLPPRPIGIRVLFSLWPIFYTTFPCQLNNLSNYVCKLNETRQHRHN